MQMIILPFWTDSLGKVPVLFYPNQDFSSNGIQEEGLSKHAEQQYSSPP